MDEKELKLDLGCGLNKQPGFIGVDSIKFPGVDIVCNLIEPIYKPLPKKYADLEGIIKRQIIGHTLWPWEDNSVAEVHCSHFVEHLTNFDNQWDRVFFFNELYRVLKPGGKAIIIIPHWCSVRYYGDPTHCEPLSEMGFYYLKREWRLGNGNDIQPQAPHSDASNVPNLYSCNFEVTWGYSQHATLVSKSSETQQFAWQFYKEAIQDTIATLTKIN